MKWLGWSSIALAFTGLVLMPMPETPVTRFFFGSFGLWMLGFVLGIAGLLSPSARVLSGWGVLCNVVAIPVAVLFIRFFVYSAH